MKVAKMCGAETNLRQYVYLNDRTGPSDFHSKIHSTSVHIFLLLPIHLALFAVPNKVNKVFIYRGLCPPPLWHCCLFEAKRSKETANGWSSVRHFHLSDHIYLIKREYLKNIPMLTIQFIPELCGCLYILSKLGVWPIRNSFHYEDHSVPPSHLILQNFYTFSDSDIVSDGTIFEEGSSAIYSSIGHACFMLSSSPASCAKGLCMVSVLQII